MGLYDWTLNKLAAQAEHNDVVTIQATTTSGLSSETQKMMRKGYVMQGNIVSDFDRSRRCTVYYATMVKSEQVSVPAPAEVNLEVPNNDAQYREKDLAENHDESFQLREQLNEWLKNHPEENDFIGRLTAFELKYSKKSSLKKTSNTRELADEQSELREEALKKIPLYIKLYPCLTDTIDIEPASENTDKKVVLKEDEPIDYKSLSKKELKAHIKLQKEKVSAVKNSYKTKIDALDMKVKAIELKSGLMLGMSSKTSAKLEEAQNELLHVKKEALETINKENALLNEMKLEYKNR